MVAEIKGRVSLDGKPFVDTLRNLGEKVEKDFGKQITDLGKKIAGAFAVREIIQFTQNAIRLGDEIDNLSQQADIGYESIQSLKLVAEDAGVSFDTLRPTINQMRRAIEEAKSGNENFAQSFATLGISIDNLRGMNTEQVFQAVSTAIANGADSADVMAASTKVLGAESTRLLGIIKQVGTEGLDEINRKFRESNEILSDETVRTLDAAEQKYRIFTTQIKNSFVEAVAAVGDFVSIITTGDVLSTDQSQQALTELEEKLISIADAQEQAYADLQSTLDANIAKQGDLLKAQDDYNKRVKSSEEKQKTVLDRLREIEQKQAEINLLTATTNQLEADIASQVQAIADAKKSIADDNQNIKTLENDIGNLAASILEKERERDRIKKAFGNDAYGVADLEREILELYVQQARKNAELEDLKKSTAQASVDVVNAEEQLAQAQGKVIDNQVEILNRQGQILDAENEIAKETKSTSDNKKSAKDIDQERLTVLRTQYNQEIIINGESERAKELAAEILELENRLGIKKKETADETEKLKDKQKEAKAASVDQLEAVEKLRDMFKVMTEQELDDFIQKLKEIAQELASIDAPNLDWLDKLSNLRLAGLNETRAENVRDFLRALVDGINDLPPVKPDAFNFLESLSDLDLGGLNETRGKNVGKFLSAIADSLKLVSSDQVDEVTRLIDALGKLDGPGEYKIAVTLPEEFKDGFPLILPDGMDSNLSSIAGDLKILAGLKGVVWA